MHDEQVILLEEYADVYNRMIDPEMAAAMTAAFNAVGLDESDRPVYAAGYAAAIKVMLAVMKEYTQAKQESEETP